MKYRINSHKTVIIEEVDNGYVVKIFENSTSVETNIFYTRQALFKGLKSIIPAEENLPNSGE
jgi:hypothetical protein